MSEWTPVQAHLRTMTTVPARRDGEGGFGPSKGPKTHYFALDLTTPEDNDNHGHHMNAAVIDLQTRDDGSLLYLEVAFTDKESSEP